MALFDVLDTKHSEKEMLFPFKDIDDDKWAYTLENGEKVPSIDFTWRDVGFLVTRPGMDRINAVARKSITYQAVKGSDTPVARFNPAFIEDVCGYKKSKGVIEGWTGIQTKDKDGNIVDKPFDVEWLYRKMKAPGGMFIYTSFMKKYNELMDSVRDEEAQEETEEENF